MHRHSLFLTYLALTLAILFWGFSFVATKIALQGFTPFTLVFLRFFAASIFFLLLLSRYRTPRLTLRQTGQLAVLAIFQPGLYFAFETIGLQHTSATTTSLIIATIPVTVLVLSMIFLKERLRPVNALGVAISLIGVSLLIFGGGRGSGLNDTLYGDMLIFGAVFSASIYMIITRRLGQSMPPLQITAMQIIFGALIFFPLFLRDLPRMRWQEIPASALIALVALTVFATIGAFLCYNFALSRIPAARAAVCINAIPLITTCGAWLLLGEQLSVLQAVGGAVVLGAVYLANHSSGEVTEAAGAAIRREEEEVVGAG
jgi:drug/metabolite transporter (DMT)-like permease